MGRPKIHDEALRRALLDRAAALVFNNGVRALSLRRLAAAAGTSTTAVYSLFGNKAGLLDGLYHEAARRFGARLATVESTTDPAGDVVRLGIAYRDYALTDPHLYSIMFEHRVEELDLADQPSEEAAHTIRPLVDAVRRGQETGQFTAGASPERIALSCWAIAHGLVSLELTGNVPPGLDIADSYEDALRAIITGWRS